MTETTSRVVPRRDAVRYEDVVQAAAALVKEGQRVTIERVRRIVGGGSYSTLGAHLRKWRETPEGAAAPAGPPDAVTRAVEMAWDEMTAARDAEVQAAREAADEAMAAEQHARVLAEAECDRLKQDLEKVRDVLTASHESLAARESCISRLRTHLAAKEAANIELTARTEEQAQNLMAAQRTEEGLRKQLQELLDRQSADQKMQAQIEADRDQAQRELLRTTASYERAVRELEVAQHESKRFINERDQSLASLETSVVERDRLTQALEQAQTTAATFARETVAKFGRRLEGIEQRLPAAKSSRSGKVRRSQPSA